MNRNIIINVAIYAVNCQQHRRKYTLLVSTTSKYIIQSIYVLYFNDSSDTLSISRLVGFDDDDKHTCHHNSVAEGRNSANTV